MRWLLAPGAAVCLVAFVVLGRWWVAAVMCESDCASSRAEQTLAAAAVVAFAGFFGSVLALFTLALRRRRRRRALRRNE